MKGPPSQGLPVREGVFQEWEEQGQRREICPTPSLQWVLVRVWISHLRARRCNLSPCGTCTRTFTEGVGRGVF